MNLNLLWQTWILVVLWTVHIPILTSSIVSGSAQWATVEGRHRTNILSVLYFVCSIAALVLELSEIGAFRKRALKPRFYLYSQAFKLLLWTWNLYGVYSLSRHYGLGIRYWLTTVAKWLAFLAGFLYASYVFYRYTKRQRRLILSNSRDDDHFDDMGQGSPSPFELPARINSASRIKADTPVFVALMQWLYTDSSWNSRSASSAMWPVMFALRYAIAFVPIVLWAPFFSHLPKASSDSRLVAFELARTDWDYPQPNMSKDEPYTDFPDLASDNRSTTTDDRGNTTDTLSLRVVDPSPHVQRSVSPARLLGPRYLCFLNEPTDAERSYRVVKVNDWMRDHRSSALPDYIFISYTRRQFFTEDVSRQDPRSGSFRTRKTAADLDRSTLTRYGIAAAERAGVSAFWVDFECVQPEQENNDETDMDDVYRICDIVRAAHSLSIVLGPSLDLAKLEHISRSVRGETEWILEWGQRLWTVPEALLCPSEHRIAIFTAPSLEPETIAKRNLAGRVWDDAGALRQLIDHYEASLQLTQLELISIALECLQRRQTEQRNAGDVAYVLMGLLRMRPKVVKSDSDFQAFARLSLANDSDMILERILCLKSVNRSLPWHDMKDFWDAKLWQIEPLYQVADVVSNNAVAIVDASGTYVDWTSLKMVDSDGLTRQGAYRWHLMDIAIGVMFVTSAMSLTIQFFMIPLVDSIACLDGSGKSTIDGMFSIVSGAFLLIFLVVGLPMPALFSRALRSERSTIQARMFGIEGTPDLGKVEAAIFGLNAHKLKWNVDNPENHREDHDGKKFTLVDTLTCTATRVRARNAPTIAFIGGRERGMIRVVLCSYENEAGAFVKESIVRMESHLLKRMSKLRRFNLSVDPRVNRPSASPRLSVESDLMDIPDIPEFRSLEPL